MSNSTMTAAGAVSAAPWQKGVGITLALASGCFIGSSVVFTKKGLLMTRSNEEGREHAYLKSPVWWIGMVLMGLGEISNFGAYAFAPAIMVTPLGALSVVIGTILSSIFLKESLTFVGKIGCALCIIGSIIIVLHAPSSNGTETINEFFGYVISPGFLVYAGICLGAIAFLLFRVAPKYGTKSPLVYLSISSLTGSFLVLAAQGFGSSVVYTIRNPSDNQFLRWPIYPLFAFVVGTVIAMIHFLNRALSIFSTAIVTPIYYVSFTTATLIASAVLFRGFPVEDVNGGLTIVLGFTVIVGGVLLLFQLSVEMLAAAAIPTPAATKSDAGSPVVVVSPGVKTEEGCVDFVDLGRPSGPRDGVSGKAVSMDAASLSAVPGLNVLMAPDVASRAEEEAEMAAAAAAQRADGSSVRMSMEDFVITGSARRRKANGVGSAGTDIGLPQSMPPISPAGSGRVPSMSGRSKSLPKSASTEPLRATDDFLTSS
ncbi:hypothetical protein HK101_007157 [Irineochytrium annulatum]|nr:hypothetical protein HK101_007157 [Irineochytrium annulatum]